MKRTVGPWAVVLVPWLVVTPALAGNLQVAQTQAVALTTSQASPKIAVDAPKEADKLRTAKKPDLRSGKTSTEEKPIHLLNMVKINGI